MHQVIFVPGLGDNNLRLTSMLRSWRDEGISVDIHLAPWQKKQESYKAKLSRLLKKIDRITQNNKKVSLIGMSAGGSLVLNAYTLRKDKIHRIITLSSRLLKGAYVFPPLSIAAHGYPAFRDSVLSCEKFLLMLTTKDKRKIMTVHSRFFDEAVPASTASIPGATNLTIPFPFHVIAVGTTLFFYKKILIDFIKQ